MGDEKTVWMVSSAQDEYPWGISSVIGLFEHEATARARAGETYDVEELEVDDRIVPASVQLYRVVIDYISEEVLERSVVPLSFFEVADYDGHWGFSGSTLVAQSSCDHATAETILRTMIKQLKADGITPADAIEEEPVRA